MSAKEGYKVKRTWHLTSERLQLSNLVGEMVFSIVGQDTLVGYKWDMSNVFETGNKI